MATLSSNKIPTRRAQRTVVYFACYRYGIAWLLNRLFAAVKLLFRCR
jgi:hypothetical protein